MQASELRSCLARVLPNRHAVQECLDACDGTKYWKLWRVPRRRSSELQEKLRKTIRSNSVPLRKAFSTFDLGRTGFITADTMHSVLRSAGITARKEDVDDLYKDVLGSRQGYLTTIS